MINTKELKIQKLDNINYDSIFSKITEYEVFCKYVGQFQIGSVMKSPLRNDDTHPSFSIFISKNGNLMFTDYARKEHTGDILKFVKLYYNLRTYHEVLLKISEDMQLAEIVRDRAQITKYVKTEKIITVKRKPFNTIDLNFWNSFFITEETLKLYKVSAISHYQTDGVLKASYSIKSPLYAYKIFNKFKIYRPFADKLYKWRQNTGLYDIQGYEQLPDSGDCLIITKSLKDVMVLSELSYNAVAPPSESSSIPKEVMENLKTRFKRIIIFYDRDAAGMTNTRRIVKEYNVDYMFINKIYKKKDISDFIKFYKKDKTITLLKNIIK